MERKPVVIPQEALEKEAAVCGQIKALWASRGRTPRAFVDTYGCQQNEADSERIRGMLRAAAMRSYTPCGRKGIRLRCSC